MIQNRLGEGQTWQHTSVGTCVFVMYSQRNMEHRVSAMTPCITVMGLQVVNMTAVTTTPPLSANLSASLLFIPSLPPQRCEKLAQRQPQSCF